MRILVPLDGSPQATECLRIAAQHAGNGKAATTLLTVIPSVADIDLELSAAERDRLLESMKQRGAVILEQGAAQLRSYGQAPAGTVLLSAPSPAQEILAFAERERIDLIVIGGRGRNAGRRFPLGGVASKVVRHSTCCVYVVKEGSCS